MSELFSIDQDRLADVEQAAKCYSSGDIYYPKDGIYLSFVDQLRGLIPWGEIKDTAEFISFSETLQHPVEGWLPTSTEQVIGLPKNEVLFRLTQHFVCESKYRGNLNSAGKTGALLTAIQVLREG